MFKGRWNPAWIALSPDKKFLYAIHESAAQAVGFARLAPQGMVAGMTSCVQAVFFTGSLIGTPLVGAMSLLICVSRTRLPSTANPWMEVPSEPGGTGRD